MRRLIIFQLTPAEIANYATLQMDFKRNVPAGWYSSSLFFSLSLFENEKSLSLSLSFVPFDEDFHVFFWKREVFFTVSWTLGNKNAFQEINPCKLFREEGSETKKSKKILKCTGDPRGGGKGRGEALEFLWNSGREVFYYISTVTSALVFRVIITIVCYYWGYRRPMMINDQKFVKKKKKEKERNSRRIFLDKLITRN